MPKRKKYVIFFTISVDMGISEAHTGNKFPDKETQSITIDKSAYMWYFAI